METVYEQIIQIIEDYSGKQVRMYVDDEIIRVKIIGEDAGNPVVVECTTDYSPVLYAVLYKVICRYY